MTREEALQNLNLPLDADPEAIEKAYRRLVRRYPPEFQPERFRIIDDSYRQLTSLPTMIQMLLSPSIEPSGMDPGILVFNPSVPDSRIDESLVEVRKIALAKKLWGK
jgi:hypothetical protein